MTAPLGCQFCADDGEFEIASVRFDGSLYCGFHGYSYLYDRPGRQYRREWE